MARAPEESRPITVGKWLFALVIPFSGLALGALLPDVLAMVSALAAVACGLLWIGQDVRGTRASRWVLVALAVLLGMTLLQVVPPFVLRHTAVVLL